jgi:hypothetical protein
VGADHQRRYGGGHSALTIAESPTEDNNAQPEHIRTRQCFHSRIAKEPPMRNSSPSSNAGTRWPSALVSFLLLFGLGSASARADVGKVSISQIAPVTQFFHMTPEQVFEKLGRPTVTQMETDCCKLGTYMGPLLTHIYDLDDGGRIAFIYEAPWNIHGIIYDSFDSVQSHDLYDFFAGASPLYAKILECFGPDHSYATEHEEAKGPVKATAIVFTHLSGRESGSDFYMLHRLNAQLAKEYDHVPARQTVQVITSYSGMFLTQFGFFLESTIINDLHLAVGEDFSTLTPHMDCADY